MKYLAVRFSLACLALFLCTALTTSVFAQSGSESPAAHPEAKAEDVASVDAIITAVYAVISGPAGQERDWDRFRSLMHPQARLIPLQPRQDGSQQASVISVEDYISRAGPYFLQNGFFETEASRKTERYGSLVHAFSTYDSFRTAEDKEPFSRGINSFQLVHQDNRWWVLNIAWQPERPDLPIPAEYDRQ